MLFQKKSADGCDQSHYISVSKQITTNCISSLCPFVSLLSPQKERKGGIRRENKVKEGSTQRINCHNWRPWQSNLKKVGSKDTLQVHKQNTIDQKTKTKINTMTDETKVTMTPEEAIIGICSLQNTHNKEIKQLQEELKTIQKQITTSIIETNTKMQEEFNNVNDKLNSHVTSTNNQINTGMNNMKEAMAELLGEHIQKLYIETKTMRDQDNITRTSLLKEMQDLKHGLAEVKNLRQHDEHSQQLESNQNTMSFSLPPKQTLEERNISSPIPNNDAASIHTNPSELNNNSNRMQTVLLPAPTSAPVFYGKPTERPWQFLIRVEEYTETVYMWGEDMLLRGISQFLKDTALEWYCQLRSCHYLPRTWTEFKQIFIQQFNSPIRIAQQKQQWKECRQSKDETINEFIVRLRALWVEQFPQEMEADLIKHLFCKMRPDMLNIIGLQRNASLQEVLIDAQRAEEVLYHRTKQDTQVNKSYTNSSYNSNNNNSFFNRNYAPFNKTNENLETYHDTNNSRSHHQTQKSQTNQQNISCYNCGLSNHRSRDCWYSKQYNNNSSQQSKSYPKND